jgi:hypothetical protein
MCSYTKRIAITKNINKIKLIGLMAVYKKKPHNIDHCLCQRKRKTYAYIVYVIKININMHHQKSTNSYFN